MKYLELYLKEAVIHKNVDFLKNTYIKLIDINKIKPFKFNQNLYNSLDYYINENSRIKSCIDVIDKITPIHMYLLSASPLIIDTIKEYEI